MLINLFRSLFVSIVLVLFFGLFASAGMNISPGTGVHTHSDANSGGGALTVSDTLSSTKACATNFVRVVPNYCKRLGGGFPGGSWADATACTARTLGGAVPADAVAVSLQLEWEGLSNNAVGLRFNSVNFYSETACTNAAATSQYGIREQAAVVAGTLLGSILVTLKVPLTATDTVRTTQLNAGGNGNAAILQSFVSGYWD